MYGEDERILEVVKNRFGSIGKYPYTMTPEGVVFKDMNKAQVVDIDLEWYDILTGILTKCSHPKLKYLGNALIQFRRVIIKLLKH